MAALGIALRKSYCWRELAVPWTDSCQAIDKRCYLSTLNKSAELLRQAALRASVSPDTALSDIPCSPPPRDDLIAVIPGGTAGRETDLLAEALTELSSQTGFAVRILTSHLWFYDLVCAYGLARKLQVLGTPCSVAVPATYQELEEMVQTRLAISHTLHGLILAWRQGVPVISLNDGIKHHAFMEQTNQVESVRDLQSWRRKSLVSEAIRRLAAPEDYHERMRLAKDVQSAFVTAVGTALGTERHGSSEGGVSSQVGDRVKTNDETG